MTLGVSKSVVIDLPRDVKDVLVADPKIANAVVRSSRRAYIIGSAVGQTNVFFFDADGKQIAGFDIAVTRDLNGIRQAIQQVLPDADITVEGIGDGVILSGTRIEPAGGAAGLRYRRRGCWGAGSEDRSVGSKIVNAIVVRGRDQIMLKVVVAEVERDVVKQLGINLSGSLNYGTRGRQFQQHQSVFRLRSIAQRLGHHRQLQVGQRDVAGDGAGRRHSYAGRAEPDGDFRRIRDFRRRRRISGPQRL